MTLPPRLFAWALLLLCAAPRGQALPRTPPGEPAYSLGMEEGLANSSVFCILQDRRGLLWFGSFGGLSRFDGENFASYLPGSGGSSLASSVIFALLEDSRGSIWIGTDGGGLSRYDPASDSFSTFRAGGPGGLGSDRILALAEDRAGGLWAAGGDGSLRRLPPKGGAFEIVRPAGGEAVRALLADSAGRIWAGTEGAGLIRFELRGSEVEEAPDPAFAALAGGVVRSLLEDSGGRIWIGLGDGMVYRSAADGLKPARPVAGTRLPREAVRALAEDSAGLIWLGFADSGIGLLDPASLEVLPPAPGSEAMIRALFRDRRGLVWAALKDGGLRVYNPRAASFRRYPAEGGALRGARGLAEDGEGRILVGSDGGGLLRLEPESGRLEAFPGLPSQGAERKVIALLRGIDGSLWIGTDGAGLMRLGPEGGLRRYRRGEQGGRALSGDVVWALHEDAKGGIWVGMEGAGLDRIDPLSGRAERVATGGTEPAEIVGSSVRALLLDSRGRLWVGTWDGGLSRRDPGSERFLDYSPAPGKAAALPDASVLALFEDSRGEIWVGTGGAGLARYSERGGGFEIFGEDEGLAGGTVNGILEDRSGELWISTTAGLSRYDRASGAFFNYGAEDGLAGTELAQNSYLLSRSGELWFGGPAGLTRFDPQRVHRDAAPPEVAITGIEFPSSGGAPLLRLVLEGELELDYRNAGFLFHIAIPDYVAPARNRYAMRLEGSGERGGQGWNYLGGHNAGYIGPLAPGRYRLGVRGSNGNGVWSAEEAELSLLVRPPFWLTWWFRLLALGALALALLGLVAARIRSLHRRASLLVEFSRRAEAAREEERAHAAREVHDEIGQHLAALNLGVHWLASHPEAPADRRGERLREIQDGLGEAMAAVKNVVTGLRPMALDNLPFEEAAAWYLRDFERRTGIATSLEVSAELPRLEEKAATALFRVLQEMLSNVARHAEAGRVEARLAYAEGSLLLELRDDGKGIEPGREEAGDAFGIIGMRERLAALGGRLEIGAAPERGTRVAARIPIY